MRRLLLRWQARRVVTDPLRVWVEFDPGDEPIAGRLSTERGQRTFTGWLGLITALQSALLSRQAGPSTDDDPGRPSPPVPPRESGAGVPQ
jgi:hypothetical protein